MSDYLIFDKKFIVFVAKLFLVFIIIYFGIQFLVGMAIPGNYYSSFIHKNFDIAKYLRLALLNSSKWVLSLLGINTFIHESFYLTMSGGRSIRIVYSCLGFGVMSFWVAFIFAAFGSIPKKIKWMIAGIIGIYIVNVFRLSIFLIAINKRWLMPLGLDNHSLFNIVAYSLIITMMFFYGRSEESKVTKNAG